MRPRGLGGWLNSALGLLLLAGLAVLAARAVDDAPLRLEAGEPAPDVGAYRVRVGGAVARPGPVLALEGARLLDVLALAGGPLPEADLASLNLTRRVAEDDLELLVPRAGERPPLLDLNLATARELEALPGLGPVYAARIVEARGAAPFGSTDDLVDRDLVPPSTYRRVRDLLTVR